MTRKNTSHESQLSHTDNKEGTPHDSAYKRLFSNAELVESLLRGFVPVDDIIDNLDFSTLQLRSGSAVARDLRQRHTDMLLEIQQKDGTPCYIYLLLEFQSYNDDMMALRVMTYTGLVLEAIVKNHKVKTLPPILPIVLYNGRAEWAASRDVASLFEPMPDSLKPYVPQHRYFLIDETHVPLAELEKRKGLFAQLIKTEQASDPETLCTVTSEWIELLGNAELTALREDIVEWYRHCVLRRLKKVVKEIPELHSLQEVKSMLEERIEQWKEKYIAEGIEQGMAQGIEKGIEQGKAELSRKVILDILQCRFGILPVDLTSFVSNLSDFILINKLYDAALKLGSLDEFMNLLPRSKFKNE